MIPKIIHYCWLSGDPYPNDIQKYMATWKEKLPDYEFILWDTNKFDLSTSAWCQQAFDAKKYAFAADYIRLYAVYHHGGIYLDCDIEVLRSFNDTLDNEIMMAYEQTNDFIIEAGCFGAIKNHPFVKHCLDYYAEREFFDKKTNGYDTKILPLIMQELMNESFSQKEIIKFPATTFTSKSATDGLIYINKNSYAIHHFKSHYLHKDYRSLREVAWKVRQIFGAGKFSKVTIVLVNLFFHLKIDGFRKTFFHYRNLIRKRLGK